MVDLIARLGVNPRLLREAASFLVVGLGATAVYSATISGLVELAGLDPIPATAAGFVAGTLFSYVLNSLVSFRQTMDGRTLVRFFAVTLVGFFLNIAIMKAVLVAGFHYAVGILAVSVSVPAFNFAGHKLFTYRRRAAA